VALRVCMLVRNSFVRDARVERVANSLARSGHAVTIVAVAEGDLPREQRIGDVAVRRIEISPRALAKMIGRPLVASSESEASGAPAAGAQRAASGGAGGRARRPGLALVARDRFVEQRFFAAAMEAGADVYHANDANTIAPAARAARRKGARLVYDAHELYWTLSGLSELERKRWRRVEARRIHAANAVMTVSESLADELVGAHHIRRPVVVMNCPERPAAAPDPRLSPVDALRTNDRLVVLYMGGFGAGRGLEQLAEAARNARGWRLVMMGWGPLEGRLRAYPNVEMLPPVAPSEVVAAAAGADVGVIPYLPVSRNNELSLPNKLFEFIQARIPVASSDLVELRRFVERTRAGVLFAPGDVDAMRRTFDDLAANRERVERLRLAAIAASEEYTWQAQEEHLLRMYDRLD
jgi:glycosyltransferase involved in cell wall biosynthesis